MKTQIFLTLIVLYTFAIFLGCEKSDNGNDNKSITVNNTDEFINALDQAKSGQIIKIEKGTYEGSFEIPQGIQIDGAGRNETIFKAKDDNPVLTVNTGTTLTTIMGFSIEADINGGIITKGTGDFTITEVEVSTQGSYGVKISDLNNVIINGLYLRGNVTEEDSYTITPSPDETEYSISGLSLINLNSAQLNQVKAVKFASYGVIIIDSEVLWDNGEIFNTVATGIFVGGENTVTISNVSVYDVKKGITPYGYGIVATENATLITDNLTLKNNGLAGILMDHAFGQHSNLKILENKNRGIWIQFCKPKDETNDMAVTILGTETLMSDNFGIAFGVFESKGIEMTGGEINNTSKTPVITYNDDVGLTDIGDAMEILKSDVLKFKDITLNNNERAGIVLDGDMDLLNSNENELPKLNVTFENVSIGGIGERGFSLQNAQIDMHPDVTSQALIDADTIGESLFVAKEIDVEQPFTNLENN